MTLSSVDMIRVWAGLTGLCLVAFYFGVLSVGGLPSQTVAALAAGIGGFEIFFFGREQWLKRRGKHG